MSVFEMLSHYMVGTSAELIDSYMGIQYNGDKRGRWYIGDKSREWYDFDGKKHRDRKPAEIEYNSDNSLRTLMWYREGRAFNVGGFFF